MRCLPVRMAKGTADGETMNRIRNLVTLLLVGWILSACATLAPAKPVQFQGDVSITTDKSALIRLRSGIVSAGTDAGSALIRPEVEVSSGGAYADLRFNREDQVLFIENLKQELLRLGLFRNVVVEKGSSIRSDVLISITFLNTHYDPQSRQYVLDVVLLARSHKQKLAAKYRVVADAGDSWWTRLRSGSSEGKNNSAQQLLNFLVSDLQQFLQRLRAPLIFAAQTL